jgi:hypothetical protein
MGRCGNGLILTWTMAIGYGWSHYSVPNNALLFNCSNHAIFSLSNSSDAIQLIAIGVFLSTPGVNCLKACYHMLDQGFIPSQRKGETQ